MSISVNGSNLLGKGNNTTAGTSVSQSSVVAGKASSSKKPGESKSISLCGLFGTSEVNTVTLGRKKKMSPVIIAKKIAQGKSVSREERNYLRKTDPQTYRKAETANRLRMKLEEALKSARSDTAKAMAIAEVSAEATTFAKMDAKGENSETIITGAELYSAAIQEAISKNGSKELNKEMERYTQIDDGSSEVEEVALDSVENATL